MNVLIIEDERKAALELQRLLEAINPGIRITGILAAVDEALEWLDENPAPDLIFSDIQLADGISFDIFRQRPIAVPVIFCTAFDEYAIKAFETNGIDYLLKPIERSKLENSLSKYHRMKEMFSAEEGYEKKLLKMLDRLEHKYLRTLLIHHKERIIPVRTEDIQYFHLENGNVYAMVNQQQYYTGSNLDELEKNLDPSDFFRANRQYIINRRAVTSIEQYFSRKLLLLLSVATPEPVIISKARASTFLAWLKQ